MEVTREKSLSFAFAKFDGIVGLGFQEIAAGDVIPVWYIVLHYGEENTYLDLFSSAITLS